MEVGGGEVRDGRVRPTLSLSTSWCSSRHQDGLEMAKEMAGLGFTHVELSHGIKITLVPGLLRALEAGIVKVSSTHNFCPLPMGITYAAPNLFEPSSGDFREIDQWVRHTKRSIDFAAQVKAKVLVCHLGSVRFFWGSPAKKLEAFLKKQPEAGRVFNAKYTALLKKAVEKLRQRMPPYWEQTKASIAKVLEHAAEKGVKLGLENREAFEELPVDADYAEFVAAFPAEAPVGYWHDTGHADIKESMGLLNHRDHLEKNAPRMIGFHLHDVNEAGDDHQPIGTGKIDFKMVREFWRPEHLLILELSPRVKAEDVAVSKERIEALMG